MWYDNYNGLKFVVYCIYKYIVYIIGFVINFGKCVKIMVFLLGGILFFFVLNFFNSCFFIIENIDFKSVFSKIVVGLYFCKLL